MASIDDILGPPPSGKSVDDILGAPPAPPPPMGGTPEFDAWFAQTPNGKMLNGFRQGARDGWGTSDIGIGPESEKWLREAGVFDDYANGQRSLLKQFNEAMIRPALVLADTAWRLPQAAIGSLVEGTSEIPGVGPYVSQGIATVSDPGFQASIMGAGPSGALLAGVGSLVPRDVAARLRSSTAIPPDIAKAHDLGVIGEGEAGFKGTAERKPVDPEIAAAQAIREEPKPETPVETAAPEPEAAAPPDIHAAAREIAPDVFREYDALAAHRDTFARWMDELRTGQREKAEAPFKAEIDDLNVRMEDATPRLQKKYQARLEELESARDEAVSTAIREQTTDMDRVRKAYQEADYRMRDLAPDVSAAYREAEARVGPAEPIETAAAPEPVRAAIAEPRAEAAPIERPVEPVQSAEPVGTPAEAPSVAPEAASRPPDAARVPPNGIAIDVSRKLMDAGRPEAEARAAASVISAYYEARAKRFGGARGTAEDLYNAEAPAIRGAKEQPARRERVRELAQQNPVASVRGDEIAPSAETDIKALRTAARQWYRENLDGRVVSNPSLGDVSFTGRGINKALADSANPLKLRLIPSLPDLIAKGEYLGSSPNRHIATHRNIVRYHWIDGSVEIGGVAHRVRVGIEEHKDGKLYYNHTLPDQKYFQEGTSAESSSKAGGGRRQQVPEEEAVHSGPANSRPSDGIVGDHGDSLNLTLTTGKDGEIGRELEQARRGKIRIAANGQKVITLFKDADASTFMHETGHQFLEDLMADARHELAPAELKADAKTVRDWLGAKDEKVDAPKPGMIRYYHGTTAKDARGFEGKTFLTPHEEYARNYHGNQNNVLYTDFTKEEAVKRGLYDETNGYPINGAIEDGAANLKPLEPPGDITTRQHEKFARGFERYLMEGVAPSKALARVFAQFRDWLTRIYETVTRLKSPINDDIRGVFDRMLAETPERTVIAPERDTKGSFADIHEADAANTPPEQARPVAGTMRADRDKIAAERIPEDNDARLADIAAGAERRAAGSAEPDRHADAAEPIAGEAGDAPGSGTVGTGGSEAPADGPRSRAKPTEPPAGPHDRLAESESRLVDKAGNIRLDNLNTHDDINAVLREMAERNDGFMAARRGVVSDAQILDLADAMGVQAQEVNLAHLRKLSLEDGIPLGARIMGLRKMVIDSATKVRDAMARAATGSDADVAAYAEAKARHQMIQETLSAVTAEIGRGMRAFRAMDGVKDATQLGDFLQQNTGKTLFQLKREAQLGMSLDTPQKVSKFINDSKRPKFSDMVIEFWINALLSGPLTHIKNIIGNGAVAVLSVAETATAAGIGVVRTAIKGPGERVHFREAEARLFGLMQGSVDGLRAAYEAFKNEESMTGTLAHEQRKFQAIPSAKVNIGGREVEVGGKQVRIPTRLLSAEDEFFKAIASRQELNAIAYRTAAEEGLHGDAFNSRVAQIVMNPTDEIMEAARKNAVYQTFQTPLGPTGRAIQQFANSHPLAKLPIPFVRTPTNIVKYAGERSPLGIASERIRDNLSGRNGGVVQDTQIARIALGSMMAMTAIYFAAQGLVTGGGPSDPKEKALWKLTGKQPYAVKVGESFYSYGWLDPFSTILGISVDMADVYRVATGDDPELEKVGAKVIGAISKNIMSKLSLRGASDLIQAVTDPDRYGSRYVQNLAGTLIPSVIAQTAREMDPLERDARTTIDGLKARIPGMRETLMPRRDIWGEPLPNLDSLGPDALSPINMSHVNNDPVVRAFDRLKIFPARPDRKIRGVELTDRQYDDYARTAGRLAKMRLDAIVNGPGFESIPDNIQRDLLVKTVESARETARTLVMVQYPSIVKAAIDAKTEPLRTGEAKKPGNIKQKDAVQ